MSLKCLIASRAVPHLAADLLVAVDDLAHALLDRRQVVQRERLVAGEVVVEAVLDVGADGHLRAGEQLLHRLGQHVGGVVADGVEGLGRLARDDLDRPAVRQRAVEVEQLAVELDQQGFLLQRGGDRGGDGPARRAVLETSAGAVGEFKVDHVSHLNPRPCSLGRGAAGPGRTRSRRRVGIGTGAGRRARRRGGAHAGSGPRPHSPNRSAGSGTNARSRARASACRRGARGRRCVRRGSCRRGVADQRWGGLWRRPQAPIKPRRRG